MCVVCLTVSCSGCVFGRIVWLILFDLGPGTTIMEQMSFY